ncbi:MAG TPA: hypothetical protein PKD85_00905 [Saprospiraceae bacterium]|nr:hypothetical protein [Saprospiraceae bacterium]
MEDDNIPMYFEPPRLKVATFNLFGDTPDATEEISKEMVANKVDVVAIQGVTKLNCDILLRTFRSHGYTYARFDSISALKNREEFEMIFSKLPILKKEFELFVALGDGPGRGISKYLVTVGADKDEPQNVWIATSQFEPEGSGGGLRRTQIKELDNHLSSLNIGAGVIFAGDTSIPKWQESSLGVPEGWFDAWREKGTVKNERTNDEDRMDQIWWRSNDKGGNIKCIEFDLICRNGVYGIFEIL